MLYRTNKYILLIFLLLLGTGCLRFVKYDPDSKTSFTSSKNTTYHQVKPGETLYSIAFEYGRDTADVARWNKIKSPYTIYPKQRLRVVPIDSDRVSSASSKVPANNGKTAPVQTTNVSGPSSDRINWRWPSKGKVTESFYIRDPGRRGIDITGRKGQAVYAAAAGEVVYRGIGLRGYGNLIIIKHNDEFISAYAHTEDVVVKEKEKVKLGQKLADMGTTTTNKTKLHFEIRRNGKPVNPLKYLPSR